MGKLNSIKLANSTVKPAPINEDPYTRGYNKEYRLTHDYINVFRINQNQPKGFLKLIEFVPIAGIDQPETRKNAEMLIAGKDRKIELRWEPENIYDKNAILAIGNFTYEEKTYSLVLGHIPKQIAAKIAAEYPEIPLEATIRVMYAPTFDKSPGIRIDIWRKRDSKSKRY